VIVPVTLQVASPGIHDSAGCLRAIALATLPVAGIHHATGCFQAMARATRLALSPGFRFRIAMTSRSGAGGHRASTFAGR